MRARGWQTKALAQRVCSAIPGGYHVNYLLQRTLGGLPVSDRSLAEDIEFGRAHVDALEQFGVEPGAATTFEFGAGYDLHRPLIQRALGIAEQRLVDIRPVARRSLVVDAARRLQSWPPASEDWIRIEVPSDGLTDVLTANGLHYEAPADARRTSLATASIDAVITTTTLEHIPPDDLTAIYAECSRLLKPGGVMSMMIDYSDHWSHFDPTLTPYNFLRFDEAEWSKWSPELMFQNRLRHEDHVRLLEKAGFDVTVLRLDGADEDGLRALKEVPLAAPFAGRDPEVLAATSSHVVARRAD
jgi:SAM-dependent methyltransferase